MEYSIRQLAKLSGVTNRTLRYYHQIGLLLPLRITSAGYRVYGPAQVTRLQQILFYRELGVELAQIKQILDNPRFDPLQALYSHIEALTTQRNKLEALITLAQKTITHLEEKKEMNDNEKFEAFKQDLVQKNEEAFGEEIREKYGEETVETSNAKMLNMSKKQFDDFTALSDELNKKLAQAVASGTPQGELGQEVAALHKQWLQFTLPAYSSEIHRRLVQMYVDDERFKKYYEDIVPGGAVFLRDAVMKYAQDA